jgi:hypothetical protein
MHKCRPIWKSINLRMLRTGAVELSDVETIFFFFQLVYHKITLHTNKKYPAYKTSDDVSNFITSWDHH